jgi:murein DD-endopeptidase MepM/ murein hydrolase activator NlpD
MKKLLSGIQNQFQELMARWEQKKNQYLTIMLVPHTDAKSIKIHISYKYIFLFLLTTIFIMFVSIINLLNNNFEEYEITELELSNEDYEKEVKKLQIETKRLHELAQLYDAKIQSLYMKLEGDKNKLMESLPAENRKILEPYMPKTDIPAGVFQLESDINSIERTGELLKEMIELIQKKNSIVKNTPSTWPVKGYILFPFGKYLSPITGKEVNNNGIDIGTFPNAEVVATAPGVVFEIGFAETSGYFVKVAHKFGWKTYYSNLDRIKVKKDQEISKEEVIGYVGKIPGKKFYHLHYEVHVGTSPLNPSSFLNPVQN